VTLANPVASLKVSVLNHCMARSMSSVLMWNNAALGFSMSRYAGPSVMPKAAREGWPPHEDGIGRYFVDPLPQGDIDELERILDRLIRVNEPAEQPGPR